MNRHKDKLFIGSDFDLLFLKNQIKDKKQSVDQKTKFCDNLSTEIQKRKLLRNQIMKLLKRPNSANYTPGPGSYNLVSSFKNGAGSTFPKGLRSTAVNENPGPGSYNLPPFLSDTILIGSFNIYINSY